jgi:hypothetical protein
MRAPAASRPDCVVLPRNLIWSGNSPLIVFVEVETRHLFLPFWSQTLDRGQRVVGMAPLDALEADTTDLSLDGAIHHMSRCGSTLVARQFATLPGVVALSEPAVFEHLLDRDGIETSLHTRRLRRLLALHRDALRPIASKLVIKWSMLLGLYAADLVRAFPQTPTIFLHRDPEDVLASLAAELPTGLEHSRSRHVRHPFRPDDDDLASLSPLDWSARVIASSCLAVAQARQARTVAYRDLPCAGWETVAPFFGFALAETDIACMRAAAETDAKDIHRRRPYRADRPKTHLDIEPSARLSMTALLRDALAQLKLDLPPLEVI